MIFDPLYLGVMAVTMILGFWSQSAVKGAFNKYSQVGTRSRLTGADVARRILQDNDIHDVTVERVAGTLSDHYDPRSKTLRLSEPVYGASSLAAFGVAAHEVGHAIQHARSYGPLNFRSAWVPMTRIGGGISYFVLFISLMMGGASTVMGGGLAWLGVGLFSLTTIFTLVTLPVEFDASRRALATLEGGGYLVADEMEGARKVLNAAALTYVAAAVSSILTLLYWAFRLGLLGGRGGDD